MNDPNYEPYSAIKAWAEDDRPREKLLLKGKSVLSDAELLAIILGSGTAKVSAVDLSKQILNSCDQNLNELGKLSISDLKKFKGVGDAKAITISAAMELARRRRSDQLIKKKKVTSSQDAYQYLYPLLADLPHEEFVVVLLNRGNKIMTHKTISRGGVSGTVADAKIIFQIALEKLASSIILAHNHPSGNLTASQADIQLTEKLKEGASLLDLQVLDHLIIGDENYLSFADDGLL
ncbi:RadC family protein [Salibacter halophilus]|uniref:JAB domain-containing protein n=1 Tax=Salibacter halophilus TaxID=1803916 RepID=A0A6N6MB19_9FLAO|nr:DNA repair protein RadC [Salibacter halophilus]KAB1066189.1 JAB domain-containing protein [Salibacter halophilus]